MIGKMISAVAGRSIAQTMGGAAAGPAGAIIGLAVPVILPRVARALGPLGMIAAAVGGVMFTRWLERRNARKEAETKLLAAPGAAGPAGIARPVVTAPAAVLGGPTPPDALEGELLRD